MKPQAPSRMVWLACGLLMLSAGCSRGGGSRFNGGNNTTVNVPPTPSTPPTVVQVQTEGGVDPVTLVVNDPNGPFQAPVQFSYQLDDAEDETLSLLVEFARGATPTNFQTATLVGLSNPITGLQAAAYENPNSPLNTFIWNAPADLAPGMTGLTETVQFRITAMDAANTSAPLAVNGGVSFAFPAPPNLVPQAVSLTPALTNNQAQGQVTLSYEVSDGNNDPLTLSFFYVGPPGQGGTLPPPQPMTLIQANGAPATPMSGVAVDPNNPNQITVNSGQYSGTVVWDSLNDLGVSSFQSFNLVLQVTDGTDAATPFTANMVQVGNPTAAFAQNLTVVGRTGDINLSYQVFDSDSDAVAVSFEVSFNGIDFVPMTLSNASGGAISGNTITGVTSSPSGAGQSVVWNATNDLPVGVTGGVIRVSVVDDDRATVVPNTLPNAPANPNLPPLPNLFLHGGLAGFPAGTLFFLSPTVPLAGPPVIVKVRSGLNDPFYAPTLGGTFEIEGENFGTDESLVTILINNLTQDVVEADSNVILGRTTARAQTGLLQVIINGVPSNLVPVLIPGQDYWEDTTQVTDDDEVSLPAVNDPSVHGEFHDLDGDGDLDIVVAQDGANSILINRNFNEKITTLKPGPYTITPTTNRLDVTIVQSAISRNRGPYNVSVDDTLNIVGLRRSNGPNTPVTVAQETMTPMTTAAQVPSGQSFSATSAGYIAALANSAGRTGATGSGRLFDVSVLNRRQLEVFPRVAQDRLAIYESGTGAFAGRRPLGFNQTYRPGFGATGTDQLRLASNGPFAVGDTLSNGVVEAAIARVQDLGNGEFRLDVTAQRGFQGGQTLVSQVGISGVILEVVRSPGLPLGGTTLSVNLPTGTLSSTALVNTLNDAAIAAGLDVPGLVVNLMVAAGGGFIPGATVTTPGGSTGTVLRVIDGSILRLRTTDPFVSGDALLQNGAQLTTVTTVLATRNGFLARLASNGLSVELASDDVLVVGNGGANQPLGFVSTRLFTTQVPDASGNWSFGAEFQDLTISIGDGVSAGLTAITVPLAGTMTSGDIITAINAVGLPARLQGNMNAGRFEASLASPDGRIELGTDDPTLSIHIADRGAQRVLGFTGRFVKPHARGLGTFEDQTGTRLPQQGADFSTKIEVFDADEDGDPDLFETNALAGNRIFLAQQTGVFTDRSTDLLPQLLDESFASESGDLDNDGDLDIVIANRGRNRVLENRTGDMNPMTGQPFAPGTLFERSADVFSATVDASSLKFTSDVGIADLDGDGLQDIVFANLTRSAGDGPFVFFNQFTAFAGSTPAAPKFAMTSQVYPAVQLMGGETLQEIVQESDRPFGPGSLPGQNFSVGLGDINADGRVDIVLANEFRGTIGFQNQGYIQSRNNIVVDLADIVPFRKGDMVQVGTDMATVLETVTGGPGGSSSSQLLALDSLPASFAAGMAVSQVGTNRLRTIINVPNPADNMGQNLLEVNFDAVVAPNVFEVREFVQVLDGGTMAVKQTLQVLSVVIPGSTPNSVRIQFATPVNAVGGDLLQEATASGTIRQANLGAFVARTQLPPYTHLVLNGLNSPLQSIFDYPETINLGNGIVVNRRGSDSSKDVALGDENGYLRERTPNTPSFLVQTTQTNGGGHNTFARLVAFANAEDRFDVVFDLGNIFFVINDAVGFKRNGFSDNLTPFLVTPFIVNDQGGNAVKAHTPTDAVQSFGCDLGDIDNDGDLDILYLNGGGQGQGAQNLLYNSKLEPNSVDQLQAGYP